MISEIIFKSVVSLPVLGLSIVAYTNPSIMTIVGTGITQNYLD